MKDRIEFYDGNNLVAAINSDMVPPTESKISIRGVIWEVVSVTYALDHADSIGDSRMRANVDLEAC